MSTNPPPLTEGIRIYGEWWYDADTDGLAHRFIAGACIVAEDLWDRERLALDPETFTVVREAGHIGWQARAVSVKEVGIETAIEKVRAWRPPLAVGPREAQMEIKAYEGCRDAE